MAPVSRLSLTPLEDRVTPAVLTDGFAQSTIATGFTQASALTVVPDGRILVTEQGGELLVVPAGGGSAATALTLTVDSRGERGLNGVTLAPDFAQSGHIYLYYTVPAIGGAAPFNRVSRFTLSGNSIDPASEVVVVNLDALGTPTNHNGGGVRFGLDGKLYVAVGDNATSANAQNPNTRLGKLLRLNPDGGIPADNPATISGLGATAGVNRAIYAAGFRNPYTLDVDRVTGDIFVNDVGLSAFEEIDRAAAGANYGWPTTEGNFDPATYPQFTNPVYAYAHGSGEFQGSAITGGAFYRPATQQFPTEYAGDYFFVDLNGRWIDRRDAETGAVTTFASDLDPMLIVGTAVAADRGTADPRLRPSPGSGALLSFRSTVSPPTVVPPTVPPTVIPTPTPTPTPAGITPLAVGAGPGGGPAVVRLDPTTGRELSRLFAFEPTFTGGVSVAVGDVTGDGVADTVVGAGAGGGPRVRVFDGATGNVVRDFFAFEPTFTGGVTLTLGDVTGDGIPEIIVGADAGGGPRVRVLDGASNAPRTIADFFAFEQTFAGGVRLASGSDLSGDGVADLLIAAGPGGGPRVARFDGQSLAANRPTRLVGDTFAFDPNLRGGTAVALGDVTGDGVPDVITGAGPGGGPRVRVEDGATGQTALDFFAGDAADRAGVSVATRDGRLAVGRGQAGNVGLYRAAALERELEFFPGFLGGVRVG